LDLLLPLIHNAIMLPKQIIDKAYDQEKTDRLISIFVAKPVE
jgi:hypothetical protein